MNAHRMQRMPCNRNIRTDVVLRQLGVRMRARIVRFGFASFAHDIPRCAARDSLQACATRQPGRAFLAAALSASFLLAGCRGELSSLDTAGPAAGQIATLWWVMLSGAAVLFTLVIGLLWWTYRRPGFARTTSPRVWLLYAGVFMPVAVLTALTSYALVVGERLIPKPRDERIQVEAIGTRWAWQFRYPQTESAGTTAVLHVPTGRIVEVRVITHDVIHSFWVPRLAGKIDAIPGHDTRVQFIVNQPGRYEGQCAEFCGLGHTTMRFHVEAHAPEAYRAALMNALTEAAR